MNWQEVCEHPSLKDLPFKIELNEYGQVVMTPFKLLHSLLRGEIAFRLSSLLPAGHGLSNCAIKTSKGTSVADVAWVSSERLEKIKLLAETTIAPEICVDVIFATNEEESKRRALFFEVGAKEVWLCSKKGKMRFFNAAHELIHSELVPDFPLKIDV